MHFFGFGEKYVFCGFDGKMYFVILEGKCIFVVLAKSKFEAFKKKIS